MKFNITKIKKLFCSSIAVSIPTLFFTDLNANEDKPNILLIMVDDLGWSDLSCYGADLHETPNIDHFAAKSMKFTNAYSASPVCTPTRAALLTGKSPATLNMTIWREWAKNPQFDKKLLPPDVKGNLPLPVTTIAESLKNAGYTTAHLGKWHVGDSKHFPELQGYDINIGATVWGCTPTFFFPYRGEIYGSQRFIPDLETNGGGHYKLNRKDEYLTDRLTDQTIKIIQDIKDAPFFICLNYYTVHTPIESKPALKKLYMDKIKTGMHHSNPAYAGMIHILDKNTGKLLNALKQLKIDKNTIVIFTSDNGGFINKWHEKKVTNNFPLRSGKGALYEGGIRVPAIIYWPGVTMPGTECDYPIITMDFYPTIIQMAGLIGDSHQANGFEGINLTPLLKNHKAKLSQRELYWHYPHYYHTTTPVSAIRQGYWKLLKFYEDNHFELYNLQNDLSETENLFNDYPDKGKKMAKKLDKWIKSVQAPLPRQNPDFANK